ncbi:MAG: SDR family NAD(P)-dependent oxidoreductase [Burkholderiales bacterium]|jgi:NAD(P)-dependent dehydrogenase (short-subunit alcohol dehydrogenase family)|nr:SDR family NAD(P)-dependent oxidoreductase [Burkholderiales bacterium]
MIRPAPVRNLSVPLPDPARPSPPDLAHRVILVTGATGGLGEPLARECAAQGATVVLHGRHLPRLEALYDAIVADGHAEPVILPLDFAKAEAADFGNVASALESQFKRLDGIVHAAAMLGTLGPIEQQSFDAWLALLRVNLAAPMGLTRSLAPLLAKAPDAAVVFTLDDRGIAPRAYWGGYGVTKAGVAALARELADEWESRPNLRVNAVVPGPIRSPLRGRTHPGEDRARLPEPARLVPLYLHLLAGQTKAESAALIEARAWLDGGESSRPLVA